jgi:phosphatidylinositol-bisphosphatase
LERHGGIGVAHSVEQEEEADFFSRWIEKGMRNGLDGFSVTGELSIIAGTFNVNNKTLNEDLRETLCPWLAKPGDEAPDLYALGFQEVVDLNTVNVLFDGNKSVERSEYWRLRVFEALAHSRVDESYTLLHEGHMVGIVNFIFCKTELLSNFTDVRVATAPVGVLGVMGNKGAVSIRFNYHDTSFCFVAAHLSSGKGEVEARNRDYFEIIRKTTFRPAAAHAATAHGTHAIEKPWRRVGITAAIDMYINDHAVVVWMGDLNYRLDGERDDIIELTMKDELETLGAKDQLNMERAKRPDLFQNFCEAEITFPPTYKYEPGTTQYDAREGKKLRSPAWCDRILFYARSDVDDARIKNNRLSTSHAFAPLSSASSLRFVPSSDTVDPTMLNKGGSNGRIACLRYTADGIMCSDHRPVSALLVTQIHFIDEEKEKISKEAVLMEISRSENARMPKIDMPNRILLFDDCEAGVPTTRYLELHNVGQTPAKWSFMSVTPGRPPTPAWLTVSPQLDVCLRGEQQAIAVTVCIPEEDARSAVSLKEERIDDILVVRVQGGCDFFVPIDVPVQGTLSASVASSSVRTKRQLGHVSITRGEGSSANALAVVSSAASSSALTPASTVFSCLAADGSAAEEERGGLTTPEPVTSEEDAVTSMTHNALHVMSGLSTHSTGGDGAHDSSDSDLEAEDEEGGRVETVARALADARVSDVPVSVAGKES